MLLTLISWYNRLWKRQPAPPPENFKAELETDSETDGGSKGTTDSEPQAAMTQHIDHGEVSVQDLLQGLPVVKTTDSVGRALSLGCQLLPSLVRQEGSGHGKGAGGSVLPCEGYLSSTSADPRSTATSAGAVGGRRKETAYHDHTSLQGMII
mmetsp:Transcript_2078/g.4688  ORF Transcript_2078/g.4688 Transcript_2078/m.4688 type:complete len:152 (+) Transcript_2078:1280-1735(+)